MIFVNVLCVGLCFSFFSKKIGHVTFFPFPPHFRSFFPSFLLFSCVRRTFRSSNGASFLPQFPASFLHRRRVQGPVSQKEIADNRKAFAANDKDKDGNHPPPPPPPPPPLCFSSLLLLPGRLILALTFLLFFSSFFSFFSLSIPGILSRHEFHELVKDIKLRVRSDVNLDRVFGT